MGSCWGWKRAGRCGFWGCFDFLGFEAGRVESRLLDSRLLDSGQLDTGLSRLKGSGKQDV